MRFQPPKGTRDFLPEEMIKRQFIFDTLREVFEEYGFSPMETPAIESWSVLSVKGAGGPEALMESYHFKDKGGRDIGLRYDLTVPLARVIAMNLSIPLPFKRYQISRAWRYGDIKRDRFREFWQADIDTVGSESMLADAEVVACAIQALKKLGFRDFVVRMNNRKILSALIEYAGVGKKKVMEAFRAIDKLDKIGVEGVREELLSRGISGEASGKILDFISIEGKAGKVLGEAETMIGANEEGRKGIGELRELIDYLKALQVGPKFKVDLSLARGLDYYTGPIFEVSAKEGMGSIAGGGRYDRLIGLFSGRDVPATGISLGIEGITELMEELELFATTKTKTKVFVVAVNKRFLMEAIKIAQMLRDGGVPAEFDLRGRSLTRQLEFADSKGIPYTAIVGEKELQREVVTLRDMKKRVEREVPIGELVSELRGRSLK